MNERSGDLDLRIVLTASDSGTISLAEGILEGAEIPYLAKGEHIQDLYGLGRLYPINPVIGPVEIQVNSEDEKRALVLLSAIVRD